MAQLDFFSYSEQYFLVSSTFWLFYLGCLALFIAPFIGVMKIRVLISDYICMDDDEVLMNEFFFSVDRSINEKNFSFFK